MTSAPPDPKRVEMFWRRVHKTEECWLWVGAKQRRGYGRFRVFDRLEPAHRVAYKLTRGPIPVGMHVCHHCDVTGCVRPDHLFLGTDSDNMLDASRKGRCSMQQYPERHARLGVRPCHCIHGHEYTPENTRIGKSRKGWRRSCRACDLARQHRALAPRRG